MLTRLLLLSALVCLINAAPCPFPNGTDTAVHVYSCGGPSDTITIVDYTLTDTDGKPLYPIDPNKPFVLDLHSYNSGPVYTDTKADVRIFEYQMSWTTGQCGWAEIPTFGKLDKIDSCDFAHNCPWAQGDLDLKMTLDFSDYASIISMLTKNSAVMLQLNLKNYNEGSNHEEIGCFVGQMKIA